jgi:unsaturated rhamnogalacturonyl hydrolase
MKPPADLPPVDCPPAAVPPAPAIAPPAVDMARLALNAFARHAAAHTLRHYTGIVSLHGLARLGLTQKETRGDEAVLDHARRMFAPFLTGRLRFETNFPNYLVGGNGAAFLWWKDELPGADADLFLPYIDEVLHQAARDRDGILCHPEAPAGEKVWIDVAFGVSPFLLFCGLKLGRADCIDEAWAQTRKLCAVLRDPEVGLMHQAKNFHVRGRLTGDHWSRGNGWGLLALAELVQYLPEEHPARADMLAAYRDLIAACLRTQGKAGLWHQEMTGPESYVETSGSALILYAIGAGLEHGLLDGAHRRAFEKGLRGLLSYIAVDGSMHNTCTGCLAPGDGSREAYMRHPHELNDPHAFGPVILACTQALRLGITGISVIED